MPAITRPLLVDACPEWATQWHPEKNAHPSPEAITTGSTKVVWWRAQPCGHEWPAPVAQRAQSKNPCYVCSGKRILAGFNDLPTLSPQWASQWHPDRNTLAATDVGPKSERIAWWRAEPCGHTWDAKIVDRTRSNVACWVCTGRRIIAGVNDLATLHPEVAAEWHPTLNGGATPVGHAPKASTTRWWLSARCGHAWKTSVASRTREGTGCSICDGKTVLAGFNDISTTHPGAAADWHPNLNGEVTPQMVIAGSDKVYWWLCPVGHHYERSVDHRTRLNIACLYCTGREVWVGFNDAGTTHPVLCEEWHPTKNTLIPQELTAKATEKVWWLCKTCQHEWPASVYARSTPGVDRARGTGCPECRWKFSGTSPTETELYEAMLPHIPDLRASHALARSPGYAAKRKTWRVDMFSAALNLVIEYDGELWHLPSIFPGGVEKGTAVLERDHAKTTDLLGQGYRVIRVRSGKLPQITEDDLLVPVRARGQAVADNLVKHLRSLGVLPSESV